MIKSFDRRFLTERLLCLILVSCCGAWIGYSSYQEYLQTGRLERENISSHLMMLERALVPQLVTLDSALNGIANDIYSANSSAARQTALNERLALLSRTISGVDAIHVFSSNGEVLASSIAKTSANSSLGGAGIAPVFKTMRGNGLHFLGSFNKVQDASSLALVHEMYATNGDLSGLVLAEMDPVPIAGLLNANRYTPDTHIVLKSDNFNALDSAIEMVVVRTIQPFSKMMGQQIALSASRDVDAIYANWRQKYKSIAFLFGGLSALAFGVICLHQCRQKALALLTHMRSQTLTASEAKLQSLFDATSDAMLISDEFGTIRMANHQVENLLGYSIEEIIGSSIDHLVPTSARSGHAKFRAEFLKTPSTRRMSPGRSVLAQRKDGSEVHVEISLSRIETDEELLFASALRDITERLQLSENLKANEARLRAIFENDPDCIKMVNEDGVLIDINPAGLSLIEADTRSLVVGKAAVDFIAQEYHDAFCDLHARVLRGETVQMVFEVVGLKGRRRWMETRAVPLQVNGRTTQLSVTRDITERKNSQCRLMHLAHYDQLTGLPNRTLLIDRLHHALTTCSVTREHGALMFIDMDNFKSLKHTLGHDLSRQMLKSIALRLTCFVGEDDTVARLGGDEFMVVLAKLSNDKAEAVRNAEEVAVKILASLSQPYELGEYIHHSTASIGITMFQSQVGAQEDLVKQADLAMYRAKRSGRNVVRFFDQEMEQVVKQRLAMDKDLRIAVSAKQFVLHFQAQVTELGRVTGAEVLVRWIHPQRGVVPPAEFIPLAEETGIIRALGKWVLEAACVQLALWGRKAATAHLTLAVNVSALQFAHPEFVDLVQATLRQTGASPLRLKLELTESVMVGNMPEIIEKMKAIKSMGVGFSLDDFGTGYSSLSYLNCMPLNQLKIDQSFVRNVLISANDAAITRTIIALAKRLNLEVIAEGVETKSQRDFLAAAGCRAYQGYFYSRPLPLEDFQATLVAGFPPNLLFADALLDADSIF
jgi:diguanylate cyclase (GGDEF)-like protein/PAS domain S-box-containing protein